MIITQYSGDIYFINCVIHCLSSISDIKTAPLPAKEDYCKQSESEKQLRRPRTADAKFIFIQSQRLLSTLNMRTSSMNDLTKLDTGS